jgi:steroid 5-alpha reductase family enzyme
LAWLAAREGTYFGGLPLFAALVGLAFLIHWLAFIPAFLHQTENFFDLTGSLTHISVVTGGILLASAVDAGAILLWAMVPIWAVSRGTFLLRRVRLAGRDARFDEMWGGQGDYEACKKDTPVLIPRL